MRAHVKRISILSAAKVGCFLSVIPLALLWIVLFAGLVDLDRLTAGRMPVAAPVIMFIVWSVVIGSASSLTWIVLALVYNIGAFLVGGLEVELSRRQRVLVVDEDESISDMPAQRVGAYDQIRKQGDFQGWQSKKKI
jgi:hypothetical protein